MYLSSVLQSVTPPTGKRPTNILVLSSGEDESQRKKNEESKKEKKKEETQKLEKMQNLSK